MLDYWVQQARHADYVRDAHHARLVNTLSRQPANTDATSRFLVALGERLIVWGSRLQAHACRGSQAQTMPLDTV
jgi:hypothetical protein